MKIFDIFGPRNQAHRALCLCAGILSLFSFVGVGSAETITGVVFQDLDLDGERGEEEPVAAGLRVLIYGEGGKILAQSQTADDGRYRAIVDKPGETIRVTPSGLGTRMASRSFPSEAIELSGSNDTVRIDIGLARVTEVMRRGTAPAKEASKSAQTKRLAPGAGAQKRWPGGLPAPNAGLWVTARCVGPNGVFDLDDTADDRFASAWGFITDPFFVVGFTYKMPDFLPGVGERCRIFLADEKGAVEPPPLPPDPPGGSGSG